MGMKEVLCIKRPGFFTAAGVRYGPVYNEVCKVVSVQNGFVSDGRLWYPEFVYYKIEGYSDKDPEGFPLFLARYFVDLVSDKELEYDLNDVDYIKLAPIE